MVVQTLKEGLFVRGWTCKYEPEQLIACEVPGRARVELDSEETVRLSSTEKRVQCQFAADEKSAVCRASGIDFPEEGRPSRASQLARANPWLYELPEEARKWSSVKIDAELARIRREKLKD